MVLYDIDTPFNQDFIKSLGLNIELNKERDMFSIKNGDEETQIIGIYDNIEGCIHSICPGRCTGKWLELLKFIDEHYPLAIYHEDFDVYLIHENWSDEERNKKLNEAICECRKKLKLNE